MAISEDVIKINDDTAMQVSADVTDDPEEPLYTDYNVTTLTVTEAGSYWLTGYDVINKVAGTAYPNCREIDASESTGDIVLVGNYKSNNLIAGKGKSSLWGGIEGSDTLVGGEDRDMFWYGQGDGNDLVLDFTAGTEDTADVLNLYGGSFKSISRSVNYLNVTMADDKSVSVNISAAVDTAILYAGGGDTNLLKAKIGANYTGNSLSYAEDISYYQGGSHNDILVLNGGTDAKVVWLDGSKGQSYVSIEIIDGSESSGADQLAGTTASESILGGRGDTSLWGGQGAASDTLRAGTGDNLLYYGYGEGDDVITDTHRNDKVMLYNMTLSQLTAADISGEIVKVRTTAGHTLTVNGKVGFFVLGDGTSWVPDHHTNTWSRA